MTPQDSTHLGYDVMSQSVSAAVESAVDAYATKLLRMKSPPEACVDDSLGPYVTSMLRRSMGPENEDVRDLEEFDSLVELLEEHCSLSAKDALSALSTIAKAVRTGEMDEQVGRVGANSVLDMIGPTFDDGTQFSFSKEDDIVSFNPQASDNYHSITLESPLRTGTNPLRSPDKFISVDLMGMLDDPSTPQTKNFIRAFILPDPEPEAFPPLGSTPPPVVTKKSGKPPRNSTREQGKDLAASLFRPATRSRQQSIDESDGYASSASQTSPPVSRSDSVCQSFPPNNEMQYYQQHQLNSSIDMLLSMNPDLSEDAARQASILGKADINVSQYVVDGAMSAPPVCRHMLNDGCYRSDCQFSHDVDGHTCLFWLRGRCGKGHSCRFRHGFSDKLLDGMSQGTSAEKKEDPYTLSASSKPLPIATKNLVSHNIASMASSWSSGGGFPMGGFSQPLQGHQPSSGWEDYGTSSVSLDKRRSNSFSFASVATKGYKNDSFASSGVSQTLEAKTKSVKIPQDLWNPHINRDASAFQIIDPLERYFAVSKSVARADTIDLHFQSASTFSVVLSKVLPQKLQDNDEVWIVTGSGHHVTRDSHQKGGGVLESAVLNWLKKEGYSFTRGRDRNGHSDAVLVRRNFI